MDKIKRLYVNSEMVDKDDPFAIFAAGCKSRNPEIEQLKKDLRHFVEMNNNLAEMLDSKGEEIKKLKK